MIVHCDMTFDLLNRSPVFPGAITTRARCPRKRPIGSYNSLIRVLINKKDFLAATQVDL